MFLEYCLDWVYILQQATLKNCHRWAVEEMYKLVYMWLTIGYLPYVKFTNISNLTKCFVVL